MQKTRSLCAVGVLIAAAHAQVQLVKDISTLPPQNPSSRPTPVVAFGGWFYFSVAYDATHGEELYRTRGTPGSLELVKDINPGTLGSKPSSFVVGGPWLYFSAEEPQGGRELWRTDGTARGTVRVVDLIAGAASSQAAPLLAVGAKLFFRAYEPTTGLELYVTNGTQQGTRLVKDIQPGTGSSLPADLVALGSAVIFRATGPKGTEPYRSDGTSGGTFLLKDISSTITNPFGDAAPRDFTVFGNAVYFIAKPRIDAPNLWKTDGTAAGTVQIRAFQRTSIFPTFFETRILGVHGQRLVLAADDGSGAGQEPWISDGTSTGTKLLRDIAISTSQFGNSSFPSGFASDGKAFYFSAQNEMWGAELWRSDGTTAGTTLVRDIAPGRLAGRPASIVHDGQRLLFSAFESSTGLELWSSDGTANGTKLVRDIRPGKDASIPGTLVVVPGGGVLFSADDGKHGTELWRSDGSWVGTVLVADVQPPLRPYTSSNPTHFHDANGLVVFRCHDGVHGIEPWRSDGTANGTFMLKDIQPGGGNSWPEEFTTIGKTTFFAASDVGNGSNVQLFATDGSNAGTRKLTTAPGGQYGLRPRELVEWKGLLWFCGDDPQGQALWRSDGTPQGTFAVKVFATRMFVWDMLPTPAGDTLFLVGADSTRGREIWKSDGTTAGTVFVKETAAGPWGSPPLELYGWRNKLWFAVGAWLWTSDGTAQGTAPLQSVGYPRGFTPVGDRLFFSTIVTRELWVTDGKTVARIPGVQVDRVHPWLTNWNDALLLFRGRDATHGAELWRSDGTSTGTRLVKDISPGTSDGLFSQPVPVGSRLVYFSGYEATTGVELWRSDATGFGTQLVQDRFLGSEGGHAGDMTLARGTVLLGANDGTTGMELYRFDPGATAQLVGTGCGSRVAPPRLTVTDPVLGGNMVMKGARAPVSVVAAAAFGFRGTHSLYLGQLCWSHVDIQRWHTHLAVFVTNKADWQVAFPIPNDARLIGLHAALQTWYLPTSSPLRFDLSNGVWLTLGR